MRIQYVGPFRPGVEVHLPDGVTVQVAFEQVRTFPDEVARGLLEQGEDNWKLVSHYGDQPEPVELPDALTPGDVARLMIRELRARRGWTQTQLADRLARAGYPLGQTDLSRIESGRRRLSVDDLVAISAALNVSPARILDGSRLEPQPPVRVTSTVTVPLSRFRSWIRGTTPLPAPADWRKVSTRPWTNAFRAVLAPEDLLHIQQRQVEQLIPAAEEIAEAAIEARGQLPDTTRTRLADAIDNYNTRLLALNDSTHPEQRHQQQRGRPRHPLPRQRPARAQKTSSPADPKAHRT